MTEVYHFENAKLLYCSQTEFETFKELSQENKILDKHIAVLFCAKDPYHKQIVGYTGKLDQNHPEYLYAERPEQKIMALNMIDAPNAKYFNYRMMLYGINFIAQHLNDENDVIVVCNHGKSRSPSMCLLYLMAHGDIDLNDSIETVFKKYKMIAPDFEPNKGIKDFCISFWKMLQEGDDSYEIDLY